MELQQWWNEYDQGDKPWLLLGKGPTFARRNEFDLSQFNTIALNHVVRAIKVDVCGAIDIEVFRDCIEDMERNARFVLAPHYPHLHPTLKEQGLNRPIKSFFDEIPLLGQLHEQGRLITFYLETGPSPAGAQVIPTGFFSAEVLVKILARMGAQTIRTLGVDGGTSYSTQFSDLDQKTKLANGQASFDIQFRGIMKTVMENQIDFAPLTSAEPMRVFIGADVSQLLGARVLEYSIRRYCPAPVVCDTMQGVQIKMPKDSKNQPRTQFSFNRFAIPKLAGYSGRAVYLDADMQVFRDFRELYDLPFNGATVLYAPSSNEARGRQFSVLLLDCERLHWDTDEIVRGLDEERYDYDGLMKEMCIVPEEQVQPGIPPQWNSLEEYEEGKTGLIHYTDMHTQRGVAAQG
jgi:hypothetical protein